MNGDGNNAEDATRLAVMQDASRQMQQAIKARFPKPEAIDKALRGGWKSRSDACEMLGFLRQDERVFAAALQEREAERICEYALRLLLPAPVELVVHALTMKHGVAASTFRYTLAQGNYLHAEKEIVGIVAKTPAKLSAHTIEAFGHAGFVSAVPVLRKHAKLTQLSTYETALAQGRVKDKPAILVPDGHGRCWDGPSERAIAALVALRRLGAEVDVEHVARLREQVFTAMSDHRSAVHEIARAKLSWVLFDAGAEDAFDDLIALPILYPSLYGDLTLDIAATLLRRDDTARLARYLPSMASRGARGSARFCHWPVADAMQSQGLGGEIHDEVYSLSRDAGVAPPAWWSWRSPWQRSHHSRRLRGEL